MTKRPDPKVSSNANVHLVAERVTEAIVGYHTADVLAALEGVVAAIIEETFPPEHWERVVNKFAVGVAGMLERDEDGA